MIEKKLKLALAGCISMCGLAGVASADTLTLDMVGTFSNTVVPTGTPPWARAIFQQVDSHHVTLTMQASPTGGDGLQANEFLSDWVFNYVDDSHLGALSITYSSGVVAGTAKGQNAFKEDGTGGDFDIQFSFPTSNGPGQFTQGDVSVYTFSTLPTGPTISAASFHDVSVPDGGPTSGGLLSGAHIQSIAQNNGGTSTYLAGAQGSNALETPLPPTVLGGAILLGGLGITGLRRRR